MLVPVRSMPLARLPVVREDAVIQKRKKTKYGREIPPEVLAQVSRLAHLSHAAIARKLGISRTTVWKTLKAKGCHAGY